VPVVKITRLPWLDRARYDELENRVRIGANHPLGLMMHAAGEAEGVFQIIEVWATADHAQRYEADRLRPALSEIAADGADPAASITVFDAHYLVTP
jgi:hypothetical protein